MNKARGQHTSLFSRPAAANDQADQNTDDHSSEILIDLTKVESIQLRSGPVSTARPFRHSMWLSVLPAVTEATRPVPLGLFALSGAGARSGR